MKYIGEVFQDRRRDYLDLRNEYFHQNKLKCDLVLVGDSITEGFNLNFAGVTDKVLINSGVSGDQLKNLHKRIKQDVIDLNPKQAMLMIGINDLLSDEPNTVDNYEKNINRLFTEYTSLIKTIQTNGIEPICCGIIKISKYEHNYVFKNQQIALFNGLVEHFSKDSGFVYVDYNKVLEEKYGSINDTYFSDGLHPNEKGYFEMYKYLRKLNVI